jgi:hypothetical protein
MSTCKALPRFCKWSTSFVTSLMVGLALSCSSDLSTRQTSNASLVESQASASTTAIPEPSSWSFPDVVDSARKLAPRNVEGREFGQFGIAYPLAELESVPMATMPAEELRKYADIVTHAYPDAVFRQVADDCKSTPVEGLNSTAVAGLAYVSLHAQNPDNRRGAAECLAEIQRKLRARR